MAQRGVMNTSLTISLRPNIDNTSTRTHFQSRKNTHKHSLEEDGQRREASSRNAPPTTSRPSASIILLSSSNEVLLLHRVAASTSFPLAHVFPGGVLSSEQDGHIPSPNETSYHEDSLVYRRAAIRECFEECGILLARRNPRLPSNGRNLGKAPQLSTEHEEEETLLRIEDVTRTAARKAVHEGKLNFVDWVDQMGGVLDTDSLVPFTRWLTPLTSPKRFTTQMYLYFLPLSTDSSLPGRNEMAQTAHSDSGSFGIPSSTNLKPQLETLSTHHATTDGGIEHTTAEFAPCDEWLKKAALNEIILFPPQFYLLHIISLLVANVEPLLSEDKLREQGSLPQKPGGDDGITLLRHRKEQRKRLLEFARSKLDSGHSGTRQHIVWGATKICPYLLMKNKADGRSILGLDKPGRDVKYAQQAGGDESRVILVNFQEGGPRDVEVRWKKEVFQEQREKTSRL